MTLAFFTHYQQVEDVSYVAETISKEYDCDCVLWLSDKRILEKRRCISSFKRVVDFMEESSKSVPKIEKEKALSWIKRVEESYQKNFFHKDAVGDRYFQGKPTIEVSNSKYPLDWMEGKVYKFLYQIGYQIEQILSAGDVDAVFVESNSAEYRLCRRLCELYGVPAGYFLPSRLWEDRGYLETSIDFTWDKCKKYYSSFEKAKVPANLRRKSTKRIESIKNYKLQPSYHHDSTFGVSTFFERIKNTFSHFSGWVRTAMGDGWSLNPRKPPATILSPIARINRYLRIRRSQRYYEKIVQNEVSLERRFAIYFLHVQPEVTVEGMAFEYQDQILTIRNLVASLPADVPLFVKEHRPMVGRRPVNFYADLAQMPGVVVVDESMHAHELIKRAEVVMTLTGTAGLEAILYGTPAIVLGNVFFNQFDGVYHPDSFKDISKVVGNLSDLRGATEGDAVRVLASMFKASKPGIFPPQPNEKPDQTQAGIRSIFDSFRKKI